jgi:hypothetical protein
MQAYPAPIWKRYQVSLEMSGMTQTQAVAGHHSFSWKSAEATLPPIFHWEIRKYQKIIPFW